MPEQSTDNPLAISRRNFLKYTGLLSAAFALEHNTNTLLAGELSKGTLREGQCGFSNLAEDFVYLNNGTEGSMPDCVISAFQDNLIKWASNPTESYELDPDLGKRQELNRARVAGFFGVGQDNICLTDNTTMGLNMTIMGLNFQSGDRIVTTNHEHSATLSPLQVLQARMGLKVVKRVFPSVETLRKMSMTEVLDTLFPNIPELRNAKALCVTHIYPATGIRLPLHALREKVDELNIQYLIVDGAQALGMIDVSTGGDSLKNCDFYACPGHKWLNGPPSTGVLFIRNADISPPEFYPTLSQRMHKYADFDDHSQPHYPMAKALQVRGCSNTVGFDAMVRAFKYVEDEGGASQIEKHILGLSAQVKDFILAQAGHCIVSPYTDDALLSGITTFFPFRWNKPDTPLTDKKTADWVVRELLKRNVQVRTIGFPNANSVENANQRLYAVRVSPGYFNSRQDIETFQKILPEVLGKIS